MVEELGRRKVNDGVRLLQSLARCSYQAYPFVYECTSETVALIG